MNNEKQRNLSSITGNCRVCRQRRSLRRCSQCRSVWYCSKACQKLDWKVGGHRAICSRLKNNCDTTIGNIGGDTDDGRFHNSDSDNVIIKKEKKSHLLQKKNNISDSVVKNALHELNLLYCGHSVENLEEEYHAAKDEVERLQVRMKIDKRDKQQKKASQKENNFGEKIVWASNMDITTKRTTQEIATPKRNMTHNPKKREFVDKDVMTSTIDDHTTSTTYPRSLRRKQESSKTSFNMKNADSVVVNNTFLKIWDFYIEDLLNISCFHILLRPKEIHRDTNREKNGTPLDSFSDNAFSARVLGELSQLEVSLKSTDLGSYVMSLQKRIRQPEQQKRELQKLETAITTDINLDSGASLFSLELPTGLRFSSQTANKIQLNKDHVDETTIISVRLQYEPTDSRKEQMLSSSISPSLTTSLESLILSKAEIMGDLQCKSCQQPLFREDCKIDKVLHFPVGNWDDIADYLMCYSGDQAVQFTSSSVTAQSGVVLLDTTAVVVHKQDTGKSLCVLAVDGYGEVQDEQEEDQSKIAAQGVIETKQDENKSNISKHAREKQNKKQKQEEPFSISSPVAAIAPETIMQRGNRSWRDKVGGGTICCSLCCSVLGFASIAAPDTYRLLKHRISLPITGTSVAATDTPASTFTATSSTTVPTSTTYHGNEITNDENEENSVLCRCISFVAREMVRYAESMAIFNFIIESEPLARKKQHPTCLLLKLLSWDTRSTRYSESGSRRGAGNSMNVGVSNSSSIDSHSENNNDRLGELNVTTSPSNHKYEKEKEQSKPHSQMNLVKIVKVIYEEVRRDSILQRNNDSSDSGKGIWMWEGVDFCCPPLNSNNMAKTEPGSQALSNPSSPTPSAVRLRLCADEWMELQEELLHCSKFFSKQIVETTIMIKTGVKVQKVDDTLGLSILPLY